jgi:hypothetical protein
MGVRRAAARAPVVTRGDGGVLEPSSMEDRSSAIAALLKEAGETHHLVYRIVDGEDPDWASWYADWLIAHSELPQIVGMKPVRSELVWLLVELDKQYSRTAPEAPWPDWYAERILAQFGSPPG